MTVGSRQRFRILSRDGFRCRYCGRGTDEVKLHIDHMEPSSLGGSDSDDNLVTACLHCNLGKSNLITIASLPITSIPVPPQPSLGTMPKSWRRILNADPSLELKLRDLWRDARSIKDDGSADWFCGNRVDSQLLIKIEGIVGWCSKYGKPERGGDRSSFLGGSEAWSLLFNEVRKITPSCRGDCGCG